MAITSFEEFKNKAQSIIDLPGFEPGETVTVKVKKVSLLGLASSGKIPNSLMGVVSKLFNSTGNASEAETAAMKSNIVEMTQLMSLIAKNALVEPSYDKVKDYLTDDQLSGIFDYAMGGIKQVTPIDGE